jgi:hypothetical protein
MTNQARWFSGSHSRTSGGIRNVFSRSHAIKRWPITRWSYTAGRHAVADIIQTGGATADRDQTMSPRRSERPDWHMRRPFLIAFLLTAVALSLAKWWLGPALLGYLAVRYIIAKITLIP